MRRYTVRREEKSTPYRETKRRSLLPLLQRQNLCRRQRRKIGQWWGLSARRVGESLHAGPFRSEVASTFGDLHMPDVEATDRGFGLVAAEAETQQ